MQPEVAGGLIDLKTSPHDPIALFLIDNLHIFCLFVCFVVTLCVLSFALPFWKTQERVASMPVGTFAGDDEPLCK